MLYKTKKVLCYTLISSLLNTSFYPLYAGHKPKEEKLLYDITGRYPTRKAFLDEKEQNNPSSHSKPQEKPLSWGLRLDNWLREKIIASAEKVQEKTPDFIKDTLSDTYATITSFLDNMIDELPDHLKSNKTFFGIDYARDRNFWRAHFTSEMNDLKTSLNQKRLEELQDIVWNGLLSPYFYEEGLEELKSYTKKASLKKLTKIKKEFGKTLKTSPGFTTQNFHRDLLTSLEGILHSKKSMKDFDSLLTYYRGVQNVLDYTEDLVSFRQFIQRNKSALNFPDEVYGDLNKSIVKAVRLRNETQYSELKTQRAKTQSALWEMPFYDAELPHGFNSSLPPVLPIREEESFSWTSAVKGTFKDGARLASHLMKYAKENPFQALCTGLLMQVTAAAALNAFKVDAIKRSNSKPQPNNDLNQKEPELNKRSYIKRAIGDEFTINQNTANNQITPAVVSLTNGTLLVAWQGTQTGYWNCYGRMFSANGTALSNDFTINQNIATSNKQFPSVASLTNENVFIAWLSSQTGDWDIYGRIFSPNGSVLSNEFRLNQNITSDQTYSSVASLPNGNVFVTWQGYQTGDWDIYGRLFSVNGTALTNDFTINQNMTSDQIYPQLASLTNGNGFVTWWGYQNGNTDVYGRVISANGTAVTNEFGINQNTTSEQYSQAVASLTNGNVFVIWHGAQTGNFDIYGRLFSPNGTALTNEFGLNQNITSAQTYPSVASLPNGNVFVTWNGYQTGNYDVYGRIFSPNGLALSNDFTINQIATNSHLYYYLSVTGLPNDGVFVAWQGNQTGNYDVYGRILTNDTLSSFLYPTTQVPTTQSSSTTQPPQNFTSFPPSTISAKSVEQSSSSSFPLDLALEIGIPTLAVIGTGIGVGTYLYKKKRKGVLDSTLQSSLEIKRGSSQELEAITVEDSSKNSFSNKKNLGNTNHNYENVSRVGLNQSSNGNTNQYVSTIEVSPSAINQYETVSNLKKPETTKHHYENVPQDELNKSSNGNTNTNQYASSIEVSPNAINQYDNVSNLKKPETTNHPYDNVPQGELNQSSQGNSNQYDNFPKTDSSEHNYVNVSNSDVNPYSGMPETEAKERVYENVPKNQ